MSITRWRAATAFTLAAVIGLSGTLAAQKNNKQKPNQVRQTDAEPAAPLTADAIAAEALLEEMTSQVSDDLIAIGHPDGTISMDLQGRFMSVMLLKTNADGKQTVACETGPTALSDALTKKLSAATAAKPHPAITPVGTTAVVRELK